MEELKKHFYDEHKGLHYTLVGDYYIPDLELPEETRPIGIWGRMHKDYLAQYHPALYNELILSGKLWTYRIAVLAKTLDFIVSQSASFTISAVPFSKSNRISPHSPSLSA